jgi:iron complex outermembrane receptor protein
VIGRWTRQLGDGASVQVQAYYDQQSRSDVAAAGGGSTRRIGFVLVPESERLGLTNRFAQDTTTLRDDLRLALGSKFEYSTFSGLGGDAGHPPRVAGRHPQLPVGCGVARRRRHRRTATITPICERRHPIPPPCCRSRSVTDGRVTPYGVDGWGSYSPFFRGGASTPGSASCARTSILKPGQADIAGIQTVLGHDPNHQVFLRSYMDLAHDVEVYVGLRQIESLPDVGVPSHLEVDVRLGWRVTPALELSVAGQILAHATHAEQTQPPTLEIPRSWFAGVRYAF